MKLNNWTITVDGDEGYTVSKTEDEIVIVTYLNKTITTLHLNDGHPTFVTSNAIIKVDSDNNRIVICSPNDGIERFEN